MGEPRGQDRLPPQTGARREAGDSRCCSPSSPGSDSPASAGSFSLCRLFPGVRAPRGALHPGLRQNRPCRASIINRWRCARSEGHQERCSGGRRIISTEQAQLFGARPGPQRCTPGWYVTPCRGFGVPSAPGASVLEECAGGDPAKRQSRRSGSSLPLGVSNAYSQHQPVGERNTTGEPPVAAASKPAVRPHGENAALKARQRRTETHYSGGCPM